MRLQNSYAMREKGLPEACDNLLGHHMHNMSSSVVFLNTEAQDKRFKILARYNAKHFLCFKNAGLPNF